MKYTKKSTKRLSFTLGSILTLFIIGTATSHALESDPNVEIHAIKIREDQKQIVGNLAVIGGDEKVAFIIQPNEEKEIEISYSHGGNVSRLFKGILEANKEYVVPGSHGIELVSPGSHRFLFKYTIGTENKSKLIEFHRILRTEIPKSSDRSISGNNLSPIAETENETFNSILRDREFILADRHIPLDLSFSVDTIRGHGEDIFRELSVSVVLIATSDSIGTGTVISSSGEILTNWHVVDGQSTVQVIFRPLGFASVVDAQHHIADVIKIDETSDLAIIKLRAGLSGLKPFELAEPQSINIAMDVHAIGHPLGNYWSYTKGTVSQIRPEYEWQTGDGRLHSADIIQTQTPINPGNSGGPLITDDGKLAGINSFVDQNGQGLNYAVAITSIQDFLSSPTKVVRAKTVESEPQGTPVDLNSDGANDALVFDLNKNGKGDAIFVDENLDGQFERFYFDDNEDGTAEMIGLRVETASGDVIIWQIDQDLDGTYETVGYDFDCDGEIDKYEAS